jgi:hypothetical protein
MRESRPGPSRNWNRCLARMGGQVSALDLFGDDVDLLTAFHIQNILRACLSCSDF